MKAIAELKQQYENFKAENPKVRIRDAAVALNTTEAELVATGVGSSAVALKNDFQEILKGVEAFGKVMALTRNDDCVHERKGVYSNISFSGSMGLAVNPDIDLRLFMFAWASAFAVNENDRKSLQFFGHNGEAIHKIYLVEGSNEEAYDKLVQQFAAEDQFAALTIVPSDETAPEKPDSEIGVDAFREAWLQLEDTHQFHGLLRKFGVARVQALRLAPEGHAYQISYASLKEIFQQAAATDLEIMVFVGNRGCIQIHTGPVKNLVQAGPWYNVLDPDFNMHMRETAIDSVWVVRKPTDDGIVTSIEVFDKQGGIIVQLFGKRKPGIPENENWRAIVKETGAAIEVN